MSRTGLFFFVALSAATTLAISACSSGDVPVGSSSTSQDLKKKANGAPTGDGTTCSWDDTVSHDVATGKDTVTPAPNGPYKIGDTFKSLDNCNDCSCTAQGILCTERACGPNPGAGGNCTYGGKTYGSGQTFPSTDHCNSCSCNDGNVLCTELACAPAPTTCKKTGCSGEICSDKDVASSCIYTASYACYKTAACEPQPNGSCGFTPSAALTQCIANAK